MVTRALREFDAGAHLSSMHKRMECALLAALDPKDEALIRLLSRAIAQHWMMLEETDSPAKAVLVALRLELSQGGTDD